MRYGSIYLIVKDFDKSVSFYEKVLDMKVSVLNGKRFAIFNNKGLNLCIMNGYYDNENPNQVVTKGKYWEIYDDLSKIVDSQNSRKVFINLGVDDLNKEYNRIKKLEIASQMTEIRYINFFHHIGILHSWIRMETLLKLQAIIMRNYKKTSNKQFPH